MYHSCGNRSSCWHTEAVPDITPLLKPSTLGDFATYFFASAGGLFLGGELGKCTPLIVVIDQSPQNQKELPQLTVGGHDRPCGGCGKWKPQYNSRPGDAEEDRDRVQEIPGGYTAQAGGRAGPGRE